jgi:hypothetical protein
MKAPLSVVSANTSVTLAKTAKLDQLNKDLKSAAGFTAFSNDPQKFAGKYGVTIDAKVSSQLKTALKNVATIGAFKPGKGGTVGCVAVAVAEGAAAAASTKIAVAV